MLALVRVTRWTWTPLPKRLASMPPRCAKPLGPKASGPTLPPPRKSWAYQKPTFRPRCLHRHLSNRTKAAWRDHLPRSFL